MKRFNIIGHGFLDVAENSGIAFKTENQHFRFAEISLGRSVEFSVPATDYNRKMLAFGEDPVEAGEMLRVVHPCQMIYDGGQKMGTLAVTAYEGDTFKCVFTIGNAWWIEKVQNLKLSDVGFDFVKGLSWSQLSTPFDANLADPTAGALIIRYENGLPGGLAWQLLPAVNVKQYLIELFNALGVPFSSSVSANYWMVTCSMKGGTEEAVTLAATGTNAASVTPSNSYIDVEDVTIEWASNIIFGAYVGGGSTSAKGFRALKDLSMTFPAIVPSDLFLIKWDSRLGRCEEIGGHFWWTNDLQLDGKTIELKKDDIVFFASKGFYARGAENYYGWKDTYYPLSLSVVLNETEDMHLGDNWYLRNNHPDMTVFEFLKSVALATGLELTVDGETGVTLAAGSFGTATMKDLKNVVGIDTVTRRVQSWGNDTHDSVVGFDSEDYVTDFIRSGYSIENEQLQAETEHKAKFSEGNVGTNGILIRDVDDSSGTPKLTAKKWTICYADPNEAYLQRIATPSPVGYDDLAANSTAMRVKCAMPLAEFFKLDPSTTWVYRGAAYLWSDADWSDGMLSMTLQRVSQPKKTAYTPTPPPPTLTGISASFSQGGAVVVGTDSLDTLKQYLTVTATYSDSTSRVLSDGEYTLSGTLAYPSATITAEYQGESDTFSVAVAYDAQVEYLECDGGQYIDTGYVGNLETDMEVKLYPTALSKYAAGNNVTSTRAITIYLASSANQRFGNKTVSVSYTANTAYLVRTNKNGITVNGVSHSRVTTTAFTTDGNLYLMAGSTGSTNKLIGRFLYCRIWDNGNLVRDFIPVRCGTVGYMYDRVSGHLFANAGTGDFIVGPDV